MNIRVLTALYAKEMTRQKWRKISIIKRVHDDVIIRSADHGDFQNVHKCHFRTLLCMIYV